MAKKYYEEYEDDEYTYLLFDDEYYENNRDTREKIIYPKIQQLKEEINKSAWYEDMLNVIEKYKLEDFETEEEKDIYIKWESYLIRQVNNGE